MVRLEVADGMLTVRLSLLEKLLACRGNIRVPLADVRSVTFERRPIPRMLDDLKLGFAAGGAPAKGMLTVGSWKCRNEPGRAFVAVLLNRDAVSVELSNRTWRRFVVAVRDPETVATRVSDAARRRS